MDEKCSQLYGLNILAKYVRDLSDIILYQEDILVDPFAYLGSHFHISTGKVKLDKLPILFVASKIRLIWSIGVKKKLTISIPFRIHKRKRKNMEN